MLKQREAWFDGQPGLHPACPVIIDELPAFPGQALGQHQHSASPSVAGGASACARASVFGHGKTTALIAGLRHASMVAP